MNLYLWAARWGLDARAIDELREGLGLVHDGEFHPMSESAVQQRVMLAASKQGWCIMRNNVGAFKSEGGQLVRYGLMNETKQINSKYKSSDLIGIKPTVVTPAHVGTILGVFVAREVKHGNWEWKGDSHEQAQLNFINMVNSFGGDARFTNDGDDVL